jgi:hypothetical protein
MNFQLCESLFKALSMNVEGQDFLFSHPMDGTTRGLDIMEVVDGYYHKEGGIYWIECEGVSTDDAPAMLGKKNGFTALVKSRNPNVIVTHCVLRNQVHSSKDLQPVLTSVLEDVVKMLNTIKTRALNSRLFQKLCEGIIGQYEHLLPVSRKSPATCVQKEKRHGSSTFATTLRNGVSHSPLLPRGHLQPCS